MGKTEELPLDPAYTDGPFSVIPMPINAHGTGPEMDPAKVQITLYEVWNGHCLSLGQWPSRPLAQFIADALNRRSSDEQAEVVDWRSAKLPCSVSLPPATTISAGCTVETLLADLRARGMVAPPSVAKGGVTEVLLRLVHQPNPTDPTRWDVAPGKHKEFSALCASLAGIREGWQPIETATKDHKAPDIILFARFPDQGTGFVEDIRIGRWVSGAGPNASLEGWESDEGIHADGYFSFWMPLPTPPSRGEGV